MDILSNVYRVVVNVIFKVKGKFHTKFMSMFITTCPKSYKLIALKETQVLYNSPWLLPALYKTPSYVYTSKVYFLKTYYLPELISYDEWFYCISHYEGSL
jgi:hypothetical protein